MRPHQVDAGQIDAGQIDAGQIDAGQIDADQINATVTVVAVDVDAARQITSGTPADARWPADLGGDSGSVSPAEGRGSLIVRAVATERIGGRPVSLGDRLSGFGTGAGLTVEVVEVRSSVSGRGDDAIVVDRAVLARALGSPVGIDTIWIDPGPIDAASDRARDAGRASIERLADAVGARVVARADVAAARLDDPLAGTIVAAFRISAIAAGVSFAVGFVAVAVVSTRARRRETAVLALLGADRRTMRSAVFAEFVLSLTVGFVVGLAGGWAVLWAFDGRVDLSAFTGGLAVPIRWVPLTWGAFVFTVVAFTTLRVVSRRLGADNGDDAVRFGDADR